tara:strand:+ start:124 stop:1404 length:1281 start_codon:yes stop_codon:yes gene_type:complete
LIKNPSKLTIDTDSRAVLEILNEGLESSKPSIYLEKFFRKNKIQLQGSKINLNKFDRKFLIAIGKSAGVMGEYVSKKIQLTHGIIIVPKGVKPKLKKSKFEIINAGHPLPNQNSLNAGKKLVQFINQTRTNDFVIFLISGGGSALAVLPDSISLKEKILVNEKLIRSGANINEIACIRKHLSLIKGGRLISNMACKGISFLVSDVIGDDIGSISSGISYYDKTSYSDALKIVKKFSLQNKLPKSALSILSSGASGKIPETPKKPRIKNLIILKNSTCLSTMKKKSKKLGYNTNVVPDITGDVNHVAQKLAITASHRKTDCVIFGGEATVNVIGSGKGGRNQELVLRLYEKLKDKKNNYIIASIGTDGIDGNTKFAGAIISTALNHETKKYLINNDSSSFFKKFGGLIQTGITQNNVNDIGIILKRN